jgi:hypothetical protein
MYKVPTVSKFLTKSASLSLKLKVQKFGNIRIKHLKKSKLSQFLPSVDFGSECMTQCKRLNNLRNDELHID